MKTFGNLGGAVPQLAIGYSVDYLGSWTLPLLAAAILCLLSAVNWMKIDPEENPIISLR